MKILCTGYKGYIGSEVFFRLQLLGLNPIGVEKGDTLRKADVIIHLAANIYGFGEDFVKDEIRLTKEVVKHANKVVFTSSAAVYGDCLKPCRENQELNPFNDYGTAKMSCEELIKNSGIDYTILRLANVYSKEASHGFVSNILEGETILYSDGQRTRDYVHLHDVASVIIESALTDKWKGTFNIGTGKTLSSHELFDRLYTGKKKPAYKDRREVEHSCLDISRAKSKGFKPFTIGQER
jgi:nucleoside-diphosphate-sugar epimerase